jgi:hypothetical protein
MCPASNIFVMLSETFARNITDPIQIYVKGEGKAKVVPLLKLSTTPWIRIGGVEV